MAKKGHSRERLREIYVHSWAARTAILAASQTPPRLSLPESETNQFFYRNSLAAEMKLFQARTQNHHRLLSFLLTSKEGDAPC